MAGKRKMVSPVGAGRVYARYPSDRYRYGETRAKGIALQIDEPSAAELAAYTKPLSQMDPPEEVDSESTDPSDRGGSGDEA